MNLKSIVPKAAGLAAWIVGIIYSGFALSVLWGGVLCLSVWCRSQLHGLLEFTAWQA